MRRSLLTFGILSGTALLMAGCIPKASSPTPTPAAIEQTPQEMASEAQKIEQAMKNGSSLQCTFTRKSDATSFTYAVKGKMFRVDGIPKEDAPTSDEQYSVLTDGTYLYSWTVPANKGTKMKMPDEQTIEQYQGMNESLPDFSDPKTLEQYGDDQYTIKCDPRTLPETTFTPPTDVEFQDVGALMENAMQDSLKEMSPEDKAEVEQLMKKVGQ